MGREVKRVEWDFAWPLHKVWGGFLKPSYLREEKCMMCDGGGWSPYAQNLQDRWYGNAPFDPSETGSAPFTPETPQIRARAERHVSRSPSFYRHFGNDVDVVGREAWRLCVLFNGAWSHHLSQRDVDVLVAAGRLRDFTHTWTRGIGWEPIEPAPVVTAEQVNLWSLGGLAHDSVNCWTVVKAACKRAKQRSTCRYCNGRGTVEKYPGQRAQAKAWEPTPPLPGDSWQLWETVSEGSPVSPVFDTAEELATWMSHNPIRNERISKADALAWILDGGWAPSFVAGPNGVQDGVTFMAQNPTES